MPSVLSPAALTPYTYSLAWQAHTTGMPITRPLYLDYADQDAAYTNLGEYLYGPNVLVAPVTTPGSVATKQVWFPPGRWVDYFTGATYTGPSTATLTVPLNRMPVFVRAGGIVPEVTGRTHVNPDPANLTLKVYSGGSGSFTLHTDAGDGSGYLAGQYADTPIRFRSVAAHGANHGSATGTLDIAASRGSFPGARSRRSYTIDLADVDQPQRVRIDGRLLPVSTGSGAGWSYDRATHTLRVRTGPLTTASSHIVKTDSGGGADRPAPAAVGLSLTPGTPLTLAAGQSTTVSATVTNGRPGAISHAQVALTGPTGWTVAPTGPVRLGTVAEGATTSVSWTVTATQDASQPVSLSAKLTYISDSSATPGEVTTYQGPPPNLPPTITSITPASAAAGDLVTLHGTNFGATQIDPSKDYVFFINNNASWGAPFDGATFHVISWSDTAITFEVPNNPDEPWHVAPGTDATIFVYTAAGQSNQVSLRITG